MENLEMLKQIVRPHRMDENDNEESLIWEDIYCFCQSLTPDQLKQSVRVAGEEKGGGIYAISITQDDLINPSGDGLEMKSIYANSENKEDRDIAEEEDVVVSKGSIVLELNF